MGSCVTSKQVISVHSQLYKQNGCYKTNPKESDKTNISENILEVSARIKERPRKYGPILEKLREKNSAKELNRKIGKEEFYVDLDQD